jgi:hypothetical protein
LSSKPLRPRQFVGRHSAPKFSNRPRRERPDALN